MSEPTTILYEGNMNLVGELRRMLGKSGIEAQLVAGPGCESKG